MFSKETLAIVKRLQEARLSLMRKQPFYAVLLFNMRFSLDEMCETAYTDGKRIVFCPDFLCSLSASELEFVLMHEVLHVALDHCGRTADDCDFDDFNVACDIVVNSNILYSCDMDLSAITLKDYGESMHLAPDGKEGYLYTAEEVYAMIRREKQQPKSIDDRNIPAGDGTGEGKEGSCARIFARNDGGFDDHTYWGADDCDDPAGDPRADGAGSEPGSGPEDEGNSSGTAGRYFSKGPDEKEKSAESRDRWLVRIVEAKTIADRIAGIENSGKGCGKAPLAAERLLGELRAPQTDWREVLQDFLQEEINDYSFDPPDRRFQDSLFLLPDFNEKQSGVKNIWFVVDTSGSVGDNAICAAYSEICAAAEQFDGKLEGWLSFMESFVTEPVPFSSVEDVLKIKPVGGGGTDFSAIFRYLNENMTDDMPSFIVIVTDGYCAFPDESEAKGIPVLWLINNDEVVPPWGKVARIKVEE